MTDDEIRAAHQIIHARMCDPNQITQALYDLSGDISRYLLGDKRVKRDEIEQRIELFLKE